MLLTIYNLPDNSRYQDVKALIQSKSGLTDMILDNLISNGDGTKKVTVGLAEEEDAAIFVRKMNGLYINGKQLYVEDVRKKKNKDQPFSSTMKSNEPQQQPYYVNPNMPYQADYQQPYMDQMFMPNYGSSMEMYQRNYQGQEMVPEQMHQVNKVPGQIHQPAKVPGQVNQQDKYPGHIWQQSSASNSNVMPTSNYYMETQSYTENTFVSRGKSQVLQPQVQYPSRQNMPQTSGYDHEEPLGFRSNKNDNQWRAADENFSRRSDSRWSSKGSRDDRRSKWDDERGNGRESSQFDSRVDPKRDSHSGSWRYRDSGSNRSPPRPRKSFAPKDGITRSDRRDSDRPYEPKKDNRTRWSDTNSPQTWTKPSPGFQSKNRREQEQKRRYQDKDGYEPPQKKPTLDNQPQMTPKVIEKIKNRAETWRGQVAAQLATDIMSERPRADIYDPAFSKELKRVIRERIAAFNFPPETPQEIMYKRYRKQYKKGDVPLIQLVLKTVEAKMREQAVAEAATAAEANPLKMEDKPVKQEVPKEEHVFKVPEDVKKPLNSTAPPTFKIPNTPNTPQAPKVSQAPKLPKMPWAIPSKKKKGSISIYKEQKKQNKELFANETLVTEHLDQFTREALDEEADQLSKLFAVASENPEEEEEMFVERLVTDVADDFKKIMIVNVGKRVLNRDQPAIRVYGSPHMTIAKMSYLLRPHGILGLKRSNKSGMVLGLCQSYDDHDKLCMGGILKTGGLSATFEPLQMTGPAFKITREDIVRKRREYVKRVIKSYENMDVGGDLTTRKEIKEPIISEDNDNGDIVEVIEDDNKKIVEVHDENDVDTDKNGDGNYDNGQDNGANDKIDKGNIKNKVNDSENVVETESNLKIEPGDKNSVRSEIGSANSSLDVFGSDIDAQIEDLANNIEIEDFVEDASEIDKQKDTVDDLKIVEDTVGNFNNNDDCLELDAESALDESTDVKDGGEDIGDIDIGDIDEDDLEDY